MRIYHVTSRVECACYILFAFAEGICGYCARIGPIVYARSCKSARAARTMTGGGTVVKLDRIDFWAVLSSCMCAQNVTVWFSIRDNVVMRALYKTQTQADARLALNTSRECGFSAHKRVKYDYPIVDGYWRHMWIRYLYNIHILRDDVKWKW